MTTEGPARSRLLAWDVLRLGTSGLRSRPTRAILSALGIAIGIAAMVAVVGVAASSQSRLNEQLARLGTNLLTASAGTDISGTPTRLPESAAGKLALLSDIDEASMTSRLAEAVYRSPLIDPAATGGISAAVAEENLLEVVSASVRSGSWLDAATSGYPAVVLGSSAAERLGIATPGSLVWLGGTWFTVVGILDPVLLAPELDTSALVGAEIAAQMFEFDGHPTNLYVRAADEAVTEVRELIAPTIAPENPDGVKVSRPSDALAAQDAANNAFTGLLLGLGSVALLVGGIGVANTMIISVLERRREVGLRRALGATRRHILAQFLAEALLLSAFGGGMGSVLGALATIAMAVANDWPVSIPAAVIPSAIGATLGIGAIAGLYPAMRAATTPPTAALNS